MCDHTLWSHLSNSLSQHFILQFVDIPKGDNIEQISQDIVSQLPEHNVNLIGFSLGGYLASYIACHHANRIKRLMVVSNSPTQLPDEELNQRALTLSWLKKFNYQGMTPNRAKQLISRTNQDFAKIFQHMRAMEENVGFHVLKQQLKSTSHRKDLANQLCQSAFPCHFVFGSEDPLVDKDWITALNKLNLTISVADNVGHMLPLEAPKFLANEIIDAFS